MSKKHPVIAITGSAGSGTPTVERIFQNIFRRININACYVNGSSFRRHSQKELEKIFQAAQQNGNSISQFSPTMHLLDRLEGLFREYSRTGTGCIREFIETESQSNKHQLPRGTFSPWVDLPNNTDLLMYEGHHGGCVQASWSKRAMSASHNPMVIQQRLKTSSTPDNGLDIAQWVDLLIGIVPAINLEWMQKIDESCRITGCTANQATQIILERMEDYVHYIAPQFSMTDINFQRVPLIDTSNPFSIENAPTEEECMLVIRFREPKKFNLQNYVKLFPGAFLSRPNTLVIRNSYMAQAIDTICSPLIQKLIHKNQSG